MTKFISVDHSNYQARTRFANFLRLDRPQTCESLIILANQGSTFATIFAFPGFPSPRRFIAPLPAYDKQLSTFLA